MVVINNNSQRNIFVEVELDGIKIQAFLPALSQQEVYAEKVLMFPVSKEVFRVRIKETTPGGGQKGSPVFKSVKLDFQHFNQQSLILTFDCNSEANCSFQHSIYNEFVMLG